MDESGSTEAEADDIYRLLAAARRNFIDALTQIALALGTVMLVQELLHPLLFPFLRDLPRRSLDAIALRFVEWCFLLGTGAYVALLGFQLFVTLAHIREARSLLWSLQRSS